MECRAHLINSQKGQTVVEYVLMLAVVVFLAYTVLNSSLMRDFLGEDGEFITAYKNELQFSYRHGIRGRDATNQQNYNSPNHKSYKNAGQTRFFGPLRPYPGN